MLEKVEVAEDREVQIMGAWMDAWMGDAMMHGWMFIFHLMIKWTLIENNNYLTGFSDSSPEHCGGGNYGGY